MKPTLGEIGAAYKRLRAVCRTLSLEGWDAQLRSHKEKGSPHPQEVRHEGVKELKAARKEFWGLLERLVANEREDQ